MTLLTICQDAADIIGITAPDAVTSSTDTSVIQLRAAANQEGRSLVQRHTWQLLTKEGSHTTLAAESQGTMVSIAADFGRFSNDTMWNRTTDRTYYGPLTGSEWQRLLAVVSGGITNWVDESGGTVADADKFTGDGQTSVLPEELITLGVIWRFLKIKGLSYEQQFLEYQSRLQEYTQSEGARPILRMSGQSRAILALNVPDSGFGS